MSKTASRVVAGDGSKGSLTGPQIVALGRKHGVIAAKDEPAWQAYAAQHAGDALTAVCRRMDAARAVTPATPATPGSGASVAAGSGVPAVTYPSGWSRAVERVQRVMSGRRTQPVRSAWPTVAAADASGVQPQETATGFYDKSPKPSAFAAAQEEARQADLARMAAEQKARGIG